MASYNNHGVSTNDNINTKALEIFFIYKETEIRWGQMTGLMEPSLYIYISQNKISQNITFPRRLRLNRMKPEPNHNSKPKSLKQKETLGHQLTSFSVWTDLWFEQ